ncbi:MAG TPA: hypothetical protein VF885_13110 [Arthrobacter sp.]
MTAIAPVLFDAFPEDAAHDRDAPYRACFNAGAPADAIRTLSSPCDEPRAVWAALVMVVGGLLPLLGTVLLGFLRFLFFGNDPEGFVAQEWLAPVILSGVVLAAAGGAWAWYLNSRFHPIAKAWRKSLGDTWAAHGGDITNLWRLDCNTREDVREYAEKLEEVRDGLNRLDPEGDELDVARYTLQRFIDASDIPPLGAKAAKAIHIKDPKVRNAAREYEAMVKQQEYARGAVEVAVSAAEDLLADRRQARSDAELIRLVHQL